MTMAGGLPLCITRYALALLRIAALILSLFLLYSGVEKLGDVAEFQHIIQSHGLLGETLAAVAAPTLALIETLVGGLGVALLVTTGSRAISPILLILALIFVVFAAYAAVLSIKPPLEPTGCGCGVLSSGVANWNAILTRSVTIAALLSICGWFAARMTVPTGTPTAALMSKKA